MPIGTFHLKNLLRYRFLRTTPTLANSGAISINTGEFTGRSPKDRFVVKDSTTENAVWWGDVNIPFNPEKYNALL